MLKSESPHVVLSGNPLIGYKVSGPYKDYYAASDASEADRAHEGAEVVALTPVEGVKADGPSPCVVLEGYLEIGFRVHGIIGDEDEAHAYAGRLNGPAFVMPLALVESK